MQTYFVIDVINSPNAILHRFGILLFDVINEPLSRSEKIKIDFSGIHNITSGFMNASIGNLYKQYGAKIDELVSFENFENKDWEDKLHNTKLLALEPSKAKLIHDAIADLFN